MIAWSAYIRLYASLTWVRSDLCKDDRTVPWWPSPALPATDPPLYRTGKGEADKRARRSTADVSDGVRCAHYTNARRKE